MTRRTSTDTAPPPGPAADIAAPAARRSSVVGPVVGVALLVAGAALAVCATVDVAAGDGAGDVLAAAAVVAAATGAVLRRTFVLPGRLRRAGIYGAVTSAWLVLIALSSAVYLLTGTFGGVLDAAFESTAGFTTTNLSVLTSRATTPAGVALWRGATQWLGGFGAVVVVLAVTPRTGGDIDVDVGGRGGTGDLRSVRVRTTLRRVGLLYLVLTLSGVLLYLLGGMQPLEAVVYAMATASTGGMGTRVSFGAFDNAFLEWAAVGGMVVAGANYALFWRGVRGQAGAVLRSAELRGYAGLLVVGTAVLLAVDASGQGAGHEGIRTAAFTVSSVVSTTGFSVDDWGGWVEGGQVVLLMLMGVGAMSGSLGGGFRVVRLQALLGFVRREVRRQLHPRAVMVVKIGDVPISEQLLGRMLGYQVLYVAIAAAGAVGVALSGLELRASISVAISALSTVGPGLGQLSPGDGAGLLGAGALLALMPVMLLGRLEITPVAIGASAAVAAVRDAVLVPAGRRLRRRRERDR